MKHTAFVIMCSLGFAVTMVLGLMVQSCKSQKNSVVDTSVSVDASRLSSEMSDSAFLAQILRRFHENYSLSISNYAPVYDSSGHVTGSVLVQSVQVSTETDIQEDSLIASSSQELSVDSTDLDLSQSIHDEEHAKVSSPSIYPGLISLLLLAIFVYFVRRK